MGDARLMVRTAPVRPELSELLKRAKAAYEALSPLEKARHDYDQKRSWVRGEMGLEHPDWPSDEIERIIDEGFKRAGLVRP